MHVFTSFEQASTLTANGCTATIGNFDGVHLAHQQLITTIVELGKKNNIPSVVITFSPHPEEFFHPDIAPALLMRLETKLEVIASLGVTATIVLRFDKALASLSAREFAQSALQQQLHVKHLSIGHDYAFGKEREGNATILHSLGKEFGFSLQQLEPIQKLGTPVSSTRIRNCILQGDVVGANDLLGRPFFLEGIIRHGKKRGGSSLGFPTANLDIQNAPLLPTSGVYAIRAVVGEPEVRSHIAPPTTALRGVTNIGKNPTFGDVPLGVETHLLDFTKDIYDTPMKVWFIQYLRKERAFASIDELIAQIQRDVATACQIL